jgi:hypothetical protein
MAALRGDISFRYQTVFPSFMMFYFHSGQLGHSTNTIILRSSEHKSYAWVFGVTCTFKSSQFFDRLWMHFGLVDHFELRH